MIAGEGGLEVDLVRSFVRDRPHKGYNGDSVETDKSQRADRTGPIVNNEEAPLSILKSLEQTLTLAIIAASSSADLSVDRPTTIDILKLTITKILDNRASPSRAEYKCELQALWLAAGLTEKAQTGRVHMRSYENALVRAGRLRTLRARKRKLSQTLGS
jgi:hypothetical protein